MKIYDITIPITQDMPVWPGDSGVKITQVSSIEEGDNSNVSHLSLGSHTGTHVDAPLHFVPGGLTLDQVPLERFIGDVQVLEIMDVDLITAETFGRLNIRIKSSRILIKTRNSLIWEKGDKNFQKAFVALSPDAAQYLVEHQVKLIGIDYLSIAPFRESRPTHEVLLSAGIVILEGIDLTEVEPGEYQLYCLPLKVVGIDGAPARVILVGQ